MNSARFPLPHFLLCLLFSSILVFLSLQRHLNWLTAPINAVLTPLRLPLTQVNRLTSRQLTFLRQLPHQERLIQDLKRQNAALALLADKTRQLETENQALRSLIDSPLPANRRLVPVRVIGISRYAIVNQGSTSGLRPGLGLVDGNLFLGVVVDTSSSTARVRLLSDPDFQLDAVTSRGSPGRLLASPQLHLSQVLQKNSLSVDDHLFTRGDDLLPSGLLIGSITQIDDRPQSVYQTAQVKAAATASDLQTAFVILD